MTSNDDVIDRVRLEPEPGLVESLGGNHTFATSIADLIDNSLDARATRVSVRFLTNHDRLVQVEVLDNGVGMDALTATRAMKLGHRRPYGPAELGFFGLGLKAASFAHADTLTVWSRKLGQPAVGRRIQRADFSRDFSCDILSDEAANDGGLTREVIMGSPVGTSVVWRDIRHPYQGNSAAEARLWLAARIETLRSHLGVTFHRMIADGRLSLDTLVDELDGGLAAPGVPVMPIDPFGYAASGHPEYPKILTAKFDQRVTGIACHIWPAKSDTTAFRLGGKTGEPFQGFYIYRHDRLLQVGSWLEVATGSPNRQLARVVLDDSDAIGAVMTMNAEKSRLRFEPAFHRAINEAEASDGTTFEDFLQDAESIHTDAGKRRRQRQPAIRPERGFAPSVRKRVASELPLTDGDPLNVRWERRNDDDFFQVDLAAKTLRLNSRYRHLFAPDGGTLNDAPMLKSLMYLLMHHVFEGQLLGAKDKDEIALWQSVLTSAASAEEHLYRKGKER